MGARAWPSGGLCPSPEGLGCGTRFAQTVLASTSDSGPGRSLARRRHEVVPWDGGGMNAKQGETIMKNVDLSITGNVLTITVDLSKEFGPSASGKTTIVASTEGNMTIPGREEKIGLNVYKKKS